MCTNNYQSSPLESLTAFALAYGAGLLSAALIAVLVAVAGEDM